MNISELKIWEEVKKNCGTTQEKGGGSVVGSRKRTEYVPQESGFIL